MKYFFTVLRCSVLLVLVGCSSITSISDSRSYVQYITPEKLHRHLEVLASDSLEGREMATEGERKASAYISKVFHSLDLEKPDGMNTYLQTFEVVKDSIEEATLSIGVSSFPLKKYARIEPTLNSNADIAGDTIVFAGYGIDTSLYSDYKSIDVRGKIVLICDGEPKTDSTHYLITGTQKRSAWSRYPSDGQKKLAAAKAHGAKAVIVYDGTLDTLSEAYARYVVGGYHPPSKEESQMNTAYIVIGNPVAKELLGETMFTKISTSLRRKELLGSSFVINTPIRYHFKKATSHRTASNVLGFIEGTDKKDEYVIISAHFDHLGKRKETIYYGADDNGSGVSAVMNIAEAFTTAAANGKKPRRTVVFLLVTGEEKGLYGSKNYVANPVFPLERTVVDINMDMIGRVDSAHSKDTNYLYVIGDDKLSSELHEINNRNNAEYTRLTLDRKYDDPNDPNRFYYRSDHYEFARKKIPITFYFDGIHADYHRPSDTIEKIDFPLMQTRAQLAFLTAWEVANREERLKVDKSGE